MKLKEAEKENIDDFHPHGFREKKKIEEEHYLQFNLTYDDSALQFVPIMLKIMDHLMMPANGTRKGRRVSCRAHLLHHVGTHTWERAFTVDVNT